VFLFTAVFFLKWRRCGGGAEEEEQGVGKGRHDTQDKSKVK
jgi:hypothetical protein